MMRFPAERIFYFFRRFNNEQMFLYFRISYGRSSR